MSVEAAPPMELGPAVGAVPIDVGHVAIVGSGLAGLAAVIRIRQEQPDQSVTIIEKASQESNTQIAGMRIRAGTEGQRNSPEDEILELLAARNGGETTASMKEFSLLASDSIAHWETKGVFSRDDLGHWFGPQWGESNKAGGGRGKAVLKWFRDQALAEGVEFRQGEVQHIQIENGHVDGLLVSGVEGLRRIVAERYVLANGSAGGQLFLSTNKPINWSAQELAFGSSLSIVDSTLHMIHPFGNADEKGNPQLGCFETDALEAVEVYFGLSTDPSVLDSETTELLRDHRAHGAFPDIARRFDERGSVVTLKYSDGAIKRARVSHHYGHLAVETTDGLSVRGTSNLYAVGDASGLGYWTNHHTRFPGFALLKCLVDAELLLDRIRAPQGVVDEVSSEKRVTSQAPFPVVLRDRHALLALRGINSKNLTAWLAASDPRAKGIIGDNWLKELHNMDQVVPLTLRGLSMAIAFAHLQVGLGGVAEPFPIDRDMALSYSA